LCDEEFAQQVSQAVLSRGLGRSYGDSSLPPRSGDTVACSVLANRLQSFDRSTGVLRAEAGLSLFDLNRLFLREGWFTPVTPGTQFVTLGGMVAADVHGKNHHVAGCFGKHVQALKIWTPSAGVVECSPHQHEDLFWATIGGMGLTGHILEVAFRLDAIPSSWIWQESARMPNFSAFVSGLAEAARDWPFTVGWIDCLSRGTKLGRGILIKGRWAEPHEAPPRPPADKKRVPFPCELPSGLLNRWTVGLFNFLYYWKHLPQKWAGIVHPLSFFYPLDAIEQWNKLYGRRGFTQYQCVLPKAGAEAAMRGVLEDLSQSGQASFLAVIKDCGAEGQGLLSFPRSGLSLALDIPMQPQRTQELIDRLNQRVLAAGGRIYLAKDTLTRAADFRAMEPRLPQFLEVKRRWDPEGRLQSAQSARLWGDLP